MSSDRSTTRDKLLSQVVPGQDSWERYRSEVQAMLERNERTLRREKWYATVFWVFVVGLATTMLLLMGNLDDAVRAVTLGTLLCVLLISAAVELLKHFVNRARVEVLKELKGLELTVHELKQRWDRNGDRG